MIAPKHRTHFNILLTLCLAIITLEIITHGALAAWSPETRLTTDLAWDRHPSIMQTSNGTIWVAWASDRDVYAQYDIYYETSFDYGLTWSDPMRFTRHLGTDDSPCILQTRNGDIWIVWESDRTGNLDILCRISSDHGLWWDVIIPLTESPYDDTRPSLTQNIDGTIWLVWYRNVDGNYDIFCKTSSDYGLTWSNATRLTTDSSWDRNPSITHTYNGTIWVVWDSRRTGDYEIYCRTTSDNGSNWSDIKRLTTDGADDFTPAVLQAVNGTMWVFWASERASTNPNIFYKTSSDYGINWATATELDGMSNEDDQNPAVTNTNERQIWVTWHSLRTDDYEIYYILSDEITFIHDIAVTEITPWISPNIVIRSAPKGTPIFVNVTVENQGNFEENFNLTAYADRITNDVHIDLGTENITLTNEATTTVTFIWNTSDTPSGSYFISANATIVSGEYDTQDNVLLHGAYIGGIYNPLKAHQTNLVALLSPLVFAILVVAAMGGLAILFFRFLMSSKTQRA